LFNNWSQTELHGKWIRSVYHKYLPLLRETDVIEVKERGKRKEINDYMVNMGQEARKEVNKRKILQVQRYK
jgi:hypothetical protein